MGTTLAECLEFHQEFAGGEDYDFVLKALELLRAGNSADALKTLEELEKNMFEEQLHESKMELTHLIEHVILCRELPEKMRQEGWLRKMWDCRDKIAYYMTVQPKINREYLESVWTECFEKGFKLAKVDGAKQTKSLTWEQVFEEDYGMIGMEKIREESIIDLFEWVLKKFPTEDQEAFISALATMIPANPDAVVEWQGRLHYHENNQIQAGAYLRVFPAVSKPEMTDFREIMKIFLENRKEQMWEIMKDELYYFAWYAEKPYRIEMGKALYIQENMAAFMFSFWGQAKPSSLIYFERRKEKLALQNA